MKSEDYCKHIARKSKSSFYYSFYLLPRDRRRAIIALYAFCRAIDDLVDNNTDQAFVTCELSNWQTIINDLEHNQNRNYIAQELYLAFKKYDFEVSDLGKIIQGMYLDLNFKSYQTWDHLLEYCDYVAGVVGRIAARIFGWHQHNQAQVIEYATNLGQALQLINILRDIQSDANIGRVYLPLELTNNITHLTNHKLAQLSSILKTNLAIDDYKLILNSFANKIDNAFEIANNCLPIEEYKNQRPGIVMGRIYQQLYLKLINSQIQGGARISALKKIEILVSQMIFNRGLLE